MTRDEAIAIVSGAVTSLHGETYTEAAAKGLIGGVLGYAGKLILTWAIKKIKSLKANQEGVLEEKDKPKNENKTK